MVLRPVNEGGVMKEEWQIIADVLQGQTHRFGELVGKYQRDLLRMVMRLISNVELSEEIVQESFIKAFKKLHLFEGKASFRSWLYQIAINTAKNKFRECKKQVVSIDNVSIAVASNSDSLLQSLDLKTLLQSEVQLLPNKQRIALILRIFEDLSFKEISHIMGCPYDTAKANYRHALMKLRRRLMDHSHLTGWNEIETHQAPEFLGFLAEAKQ